MSKPNTNIISRGWAEPNMLQDELTNYYIGFQGAAKTKVLLIEDDRTTRRMVSKSIGDHCNLVEAFTGGSGIARYQNFAPDIVFLDLELPDQNGHKILEWIMHNDPGAYVVLFSGSCDKYNVEKAIKMGAKGFVPKPFDPERMLHFINQCPKLRDE